MEFGLWIVIGILSITVLALSVKLFLMRKAAREIETELADWLLTETNTLIHISSRDGCMRKLAAGLNIHLRTLRCERRRFLRGDLELKEAVTNISHDLRTPLTAICGYLDLLEREDKTAAVQRYLSMIQNRTEVLKQLTEELFVYSIAASVQESRPEPVNLAQILEESLLSFYGAMQQKSIAPDISIPQQKIERLLDPSATNRIFSNIISNALKYSDGDFVVQMHENGTIVFSNSARELNAVTAGRLFDRFYTVETGKHSTGLGLSIAKLLTERMGGTISADYREGRLYITVSFPALY